MRARREGKGMRGKEEAGRKGEKAGEGRGRRRTRKGKHEGE